MVPHRMTDRAIGPSSDVLLWLSPDCNVVSVYHQDVPATELDLYGLDSDESFHVVSALLVQGAMSRRSTLTHAHDSSGLCL